MTMPRAEIYEAVKYCVRRSLEHEAPLDCLREYLDFLELNGWPAETVSDIGNASCRILAIILESGETDKSPERQEGLAEVLLRQCHKGERELGPPKPRHGNRRHQSQPDLQGFSSPPRSPSPFPPQSPTGKDRSQTPSPARRPGDRAPSIGQQNI